VDDEVIVENLFPARSHPILNYPPDVRIKVRRDWALSNQRTLPQHFWRASNRTRTAWPALLLQRNEDILDDAPTGYEREE
jgi:hypothetical protein